ncbi:uncharacterized protein LY89DRAFT_767913 [Mollisia scopiformis]|uniref:Uncharacterized protein n=1 Tax=Mollisia scopiformis TaxID=149040 RepID=A0A194XNC2_MOLSC|nr:uncharacterized protein LY89DRAFT_767913 [Mollisia scopiformis]KUJ21755.1 hypothetical protein LY89DRAFT_767913 [Mollisia scopiformis]
MSVPPVEAKVGARKNSSTSTDLATNGHNSQKVEQSLSLLSPIKSEAGERQPRLAEQEALLGIDRKVKKEEEDRKEDLGEAEVLEQHHYVLRSHEQKKDWDVTGTWKISCAAIPDEPDMKLTIYIAKSDGKNQMFAEFNFGIAEGVFRFEKPTRRRSLRIKSKNQDMDDDQEDSEYDPTNFFLAKTDKPTPTNPTWNYRWRGEEPKGPIYFGADEVLYSIIFEEPKGTKLTGTLGGGPWGECRFTGIKVKMGREWDDESIEDEWYAYGRAAYEGGEILRLYD